MAKIKPLKRGSIKVCVFLSVHPNRNPRAFKFITENAEHPRFSKAIVNALELGIGDVTSSEDDTIDLSQLMEDL